MSRIGFFALALLLAVPAVHAADCRFSVLDHPEQPLAGGGPQNLCQVYTGKVVLLVNIASHSRHVAQLKGLEELYQRFKGEGLVVLGFPSNDFHNEPRAPKDIARLAQGRFGVTFPLYRPIHVSGERTDYMYRDVFMQLGVPIREDFDKILIDRSGQVVGYFGQEITAKDRAFRESISSQLDQPALVGPGS